MKRPLLGASVGASLSALALAGCAAPDIRPVATQKAAPALGLTGAATPAIAPDWWHGYGDPQLDRIVGDALAGSPRLETALARLRLAQASLANQEAGKLPTVEGLGVVNAARMSKRFIGEGTNKISTIGLVGLNIGWNLDLFGRTQAAIEQAGKSRDAARLDIAAARLALASSVVQTYVDLAASEAQAAIAQDTIGTREKSVRLVEAQIRNQLANKLQFESANTLLAQAREALIVAQRKRALAANALAALAGRGPDYAAGITASTLAFSEVQGLPTSVPADLLARRPDIAAALARIDAAAAGRQVARRAYYPNINLTAFAGLAALGISNIFSPAAATLAAGPAFSLPIFEGGKLKAGLESATAEIDVATADYNGRVVGAVREASDAITQVQSLDAQRVRSREVVKGFAETQRLNGIRVRSGLDSQLTGIDNDIRLLDARLSDINLAAAETSQRVALVVALGGGFDPLQDTTK